MQVYKGIITHSCEVVAVKLIDMEKLGDTLVRRQLTNPATRRAKGST